MLAPSGVVVLGVSVDRKRETLSRFHQALSVVLQTSRDPEENVSALYGTAKFPESYIIDHNGKVVRKYAGLPERNGKRFRGPIRSWWAT